MLSFYMLILQSNLRAILQKQLMIVGIDVYHDSTFGQKKSVVGFVASTNRYVLFVICGNYPCTCTKHRVISVICVLLARKLPDPKF